MRKRRISGSAGIPVCPIQQDYPQPDVLRPAVCLQDVAGVGVDHIRAQRPSTTTRALLPSVRLDKVDNSSY